MPDPLFVLGEVVITPGAIEELQDCDISPLTLLTNHVSGDWGGCCPEDAALNDAAVKSGDRIFSVYKIAPEVTIWVITEADRSATTLLLPDEY
jgi:hypothetical protein